MRICGKNLDFLFTDSFAFNFKDFRNLEFACREMSSCFPELATSIVITSLCASLFCHKVPVKFHLLLF